MSSGDENRAGHVLAAFDPDAPATLDEAQREECRPDADRQVDEEDPVPVERLRQHAAGQQPDGRAGRGDEGVDPDRLRLLAWRGEHRHDHAEDDGRRQGTADALDEAGADQDLLRLREAADDRSRGEHRQADQEDAPAARQVAEPPGEQQQPAEGDEVRVDDPRKVRL